MPTDASDFGEVNACVAVASAMPRVLNTVEGPTLALVFAVLGQQKVGVYSSTTQNGGYLQTKSRTNCNIFLSPRTGLGCSCPVLAIRHDTVNLFISAMHPLCWNDVPV